eukprot:CAMPEP_0117421168 /NCGR_PEP_ID=MMETSP0758-20121206/2331_1 /TAXON_ID=63605 /ORGANISM="Percolomonas cosmopolitus, Strain AE-1 (ATCC 50343)" /LENGTH=224 /DNA_ID=CAMNT_0005203165 /DNA_START=2031 /DNA_END=2701 /DNA_ORIENTATION=+
MDQLVSTQKALENSPNNQELFIKQMNLDRYLVDLSHQGEAMKKQLFDDILSSENVNMNLEQLNDLFAWFRPRCDETGHLSHETFKEGLIQFCNIHDPLVLEQNVATYDRNRDGRIDFREFVVGLSYISQSEHMNRSSGSMQSDSQEALLLLMFRMYDINNSNTITKNEIYLLMRACLLAKGEQVNDHDLNIRVERDFADIDANKDGHIDFDEFKKAVMSGKLHV